MKNERTLFNPILAIICALFFFYSYESYAQTKAVTFTAKNAVYLELGGNAGQYAFTYGRLLNQFGALKVTGSAGFSLWANRIEGSTIWEPAIPLEISALIGRRKHHLEIGLGITPYLESEIDSSWESGTLVQSKEGNYLGAILPIRIGYRYQKPEGGFFFRVGYTPFFDLPDKLRENWVFQPIHAGLGLGVSF